MLKDPLPIRKRHINALHEQTLGDLSVADTLSGCSLDLSFCRSGPIVIVQSISIAMATNGMDSEMSTVGIARSVAFTDGTSSNQPPALQLFSMSYSIQILWSP